MNNIVRLAVFTCLIAGLAFSPAAATAQDKGTKKQTQLSNKAVKLITGFALTTMGNPELRWNRPFCVPDDEFDANKIGFL